MCDVSEDLQEVRCLLKPKKGTHLTFNPQIWQTCAHIKSNKLIVATSEATELEIRSDQNSLDTELKPPKSIQIIQIAQTEPHSMCLAWHCRSPADHFFTGDRRGIMSDMVSTWQDSSPIVT